MNFNIASCALLHKIKPVFASSASILAQQTRNTFILRRKNSIGLHKKDGKPKRMSSRHFVYELIEDTNTKPQKPIDVILTSYVAGIGQKGEKLSMKADDAYKQVLLPGLAVYASPENLELYKNLIEEAQSKIPEYSSIWAPRTMNILSTLLLSVCVSKNNSWVLQKYHIRAAFRKITIHVPDDAITMPKKEISGPNLEIQNKEFYITVTINKKEQVKVRCRLHHISLDENDRIPFCEFWKKQEPAIFPEDQPVLDSMCPHRIWVSEAAKNL